MKPAGHVPRMGEALLLTARHRGCGTFATGTVKHDLTALLLRQSGRVDGRKRQQHRPRNAIGRMFRRFAHIDQQDFMVLHLLLDRLGGDFV